jgi:poly-gamma-glutamate synthesis protein (capsule biosynthesis protein)
MKNKIICLVLCVVAIAASTILFAKVMRMDVPEKNILGKEEEKADLPVEDTTPVQKDNEIELSEIGVSAFARKTEKFFEAVAFEKNDNLEAKAKEISDGAKAIAVWLRENSDTSGAEYYEKIASSLERVLSGFETDAELSAHISAFLKDAKAAPGGDLYPVLDTDANGKSVLSLIAINDAAKKARLSDTFTVTLGGTALLGDRLGAAQTSSFKYQYDNSPYSFPFYKLSAFLNNDDLSFATLLAPLTEALDSEDVLDPVKGHPDYAKSMMGIDCVSVAPSEIMDYGNAGYDDTIRALSDNGISYSVQNGSCALDTSFGKVVYITFDLTDSEVSDDQRDKNKELVRDAVVKERENGADLIVVMLNWNTRQRKSTDFSADYLGTVTSTYEQHFDAYNKEIARAAIGDGKTGADVVVGTGARVIQGIEEYRGKYIVYSPGDITYSSAVDPEAANTAYSFLFQQSFKKTDGKVESAGIRIVPFVNTSVATPFLPTPVFDERADTVIETLIYQSSYFSNAIKEFNYISIK